MRIKPSLPLSLLSPGRTGSGAAGEGRGRECVVGREPRSLFSLQGPAMGVPWELPVAASSHGTKGEKQPRREKCEGGSEEKTHRPLPARGSPPRHPEKPPPRSHRGYSDVSRREHPLWKRTVLFT